MNDALYRPCVGVCLFNADGKVFVGERIDSPGSWQMPQGGIDEGEDLHVAALRELKEEIGTNKAELIEVLPEVLRYDIPNDILERLHKIWTIPYVGQDQNWLAMRFTGNDSDIILDADEHPEFSNWKWVDLDETLDIIVPFKRETYKKIIAAFHKI